MSKDQNERKYILYMSEMKPIKKIPVQDWMTLKEVSAVMEALGGAEHARFVGGCVRNTLLGKPVDDIDIATKWTPDQVMEKMQDAGIKAIPTGIDYGTITAVANKRGFEITTLRKDVETDGRRAVVAYSTDWLEDAKRRDFTMNTLLADEQGNLYDPLGCGLKDLEARKMVFVGEPAARIAEDYLRILRYFRFHAFYGAGEMDKAALKACRAAADQIATLSKERITQEFLKLLSCDQPQHVLRIMFDNGILKELQFKEYSSDLLGYVCDFQNRYGLGFIASRLLTLCGFEEKNVQAVSKFLLLPKVFLKDIEKMIQVLNLPDLGNDHALQVAIYKYGRVPTAQCLMIELATDRVMNGYAPNALKIIQNWDISDFPLSGDDLIKAGIAPGPELGKKLSTIEQWWINQNFKPDRQDCLRQLDVF